MKQKELDNSLKKIPSPEYTLTNEKEKADLKPEIAKFDTANTLEDAVNKKVF